MSETRTKKQHEERKDNILNKFYVLQFYIKERYDGVSQRAVINNTGRCQMHENSKKKKKKD